MSLKKVTQVKSDKGFRIWDILIYAVILVVVAAIFIAVFTTRDTSPLEGIRIYSRGEAVFEYAFNKDEYKILGGSVEIDVSDSGQTLTVKVTSDLGYNTVEIQKKGLVKVIDADCATKDCIHMLDIKDNSGAIICTPHGFRIVPFDSEDDGKVML